MAKQPHTVRANICYIQTELIEVDHNKSSFAHTTQAFYMFTTNRPHPEFLEDSSIGRALSEDMLSIQKVSSAMVKTTL